MNCIISAMIKSLKNTQISNNLYSKHLPKKNTFKSHIWEPSV